MEREREGTISRLTTFSNQPTGGVLESAAAGLLRSRDLLAFREDMSVLLGVLRLTGRLSLSNVVLDFSRHGREGSLDILALLRRSLQEAHSVVVCHLLALLESNLSSGFEISLVANQDARDVILSVFLDFTHPGVHGVETLPISDVVNHDDTVGTLVVARGDRLEALLTSSVPNLKLADLLVNVDRANLEVDTDRGHEVLLELVILKGTEQARLANIHKFLGRALG